MTIPSSSSRHIIIAALVMLVPFFGWTFVPPETCWGQEPSPSENPFFDPTPDNASAPEREAVANTIAIENFGRRLSKAIRELGWEEIAKDVPRAKELLKKTLLDIRDTHQFAASHGLLEEFHSELTAEDISSLRTFHSNLEDATDQLSDVDVDIRILIKSVGDLTETSKPSTDSKISQGNSLYDEAMRRVEASQLTTERADSEASDTTDHIIEQMRKGAEQMTLSPEQYIASLTSQIAADPKNAGLYFKRSVAKLDHLDYRGAMEDAVEASKLAPDNVFYFAQLAVICQQKDAYEQQNRAVEILLSRFPDDANALEIAAWFYATCPEPMYRDGKKAVSLARRACEATPDSYTLHTLAAALAEAGAFDLAAESEEKALAHFRSEKRTNKSFEQAYERNLSLYRSQKAYHDSRRSDIADAARQADAAYSKGDYDTCIVEASRAIELQGTGSSPIFATPHLIRAYGYFKKNNGPAAIEDATNALRLDRKNVDALQLRARVYLALEAYDRAIEDFNSAIELGHPDGKRLAQFYGNRGLAFCRSGRLEKGIADLRKASNLDADNAQIKQHLNLYEPQR